jgi:hypothetical protein
MGLLSLYIYDISLLFKTVVISVAMAYSLVRGYNVSEKPASTSRVEDGSNKFLQNVSFHIR